MSTLIVDDAVHSRPLLDASCDRPMVPTDIIAGLILLSQSGKAMAEPLQTDGRALECDGSHEGDRQLLCDAVYASHFATGIYGTAARLNLSRAPML